MPTITLWLKRPIPRIVVLELVSWFQNYLCVSLVKLFNLSQSLRIQTSKMRIKYVLTSYVIMRIK